MASEKYGRLFTEADVRTMIVSAAADGMNDRIEGDPAAYAQQVLADRDETGLMSFPADEPLFLLRGQDKAVTGNVLAVYFNACQRDGAPDEHLRRIVEAMRDITAWKNANPDRVKVPD